MLIQAIICEYNPFHNGHAYQIKAGKTKTGSTHTLGLMSGNIVQRGSFALTDKWLRTQTALLSGVDLVCELPYAYAAQSAEYFAGGAIKILNALNCCNFLSFGSESGKLDCLQKIAAILSEEPPLFKKALKETLNTGVSFPKARTLAIEGLYGKTMALHLREPNNILGIEYLKALCRTNSHISPVTIKRYGSGYHEQAIKTTFASASAIRKHIKENTAAPEKELIPLLPYEPSLLLNHIHQNSNDWEESFTKALLSKIMTADLGSFRQLPYMEPGMEFKLKTALKRADTYQALIGSLASKHFPESRVRRILMNLMTGFTSEHLDHFSSDTFIPYLRVLGFNEKGQSMLKKIREKAEIPLITNTRTNMTRLSPAQKHCFNFDILSTDLFNLFCQKKHHYHQDLSHTPLIITQKEFI